ncbi:MAG TPA: Fe-S protein assembly co-chaperone HscB [Gammaproteobacteria bacterium]|nr:Fe-S protein assembly co-chaperone HscB [Gammaproteobacteria bacterium]
MPSPSKKNYFELFALPCTFDIDLRVLKECYQLLQKNFHPDRYASKPDHEKRLAMQHATELNDAYSVLKDPVKRGFYLLSLYQSNEQNLSEEVSIKDPAFLMQQFELREALAAIRTLDELLLFIKKTDASINETIEQLKTEFKEISPKNLSKIQSILSKIQFMVKLREEAFLLEEELMG